MKEKLNEIRQKYNINIPAFTVGLSFIWLLLGNMPFLESIQYNIVFVNLLLLLLSFLFLKDFKTFNKLNKSLALMLLWYIISAFATHTLSNKHTWFTIILSILAFMMADTFNANCKRILWKSIFISINTITILSFIGYLIIRFTDLEHSEIYTISYSLGNVLQGNRLYGVLNSPNTLGPLAAISFLLSIYYIHNNPSIKNIIINCALIIINLFVLKLTGCRSALVALIVSAVCILVFSIKKDRKKKFIIIISLCLLAGILLVSKLPLLSKLTQRDWETGSGRTALYKSALVLIKDSPLFGYGSLSNYYELCQQISIPMDRAGSHNSYLDMAVTYGLPALVFCLIAIISVVIKLLKNYFAYVDFYKEDIIDEVVLLTFILVYCLFENIVTICPIQVLFIMEIFSLSSKLDKCNCK